MILSFADCMVDALKFETSILLTDKQELRLVEVASHKVPIHMVRTLEYYLAQSANSDWRARAGTTMEDYFGSLVLKRYLRLLLEKP